MVFYKSLRFIFVLALSIFPIYSYGSIILDNLPEKPLVLLLPEKEAVISSRINSVVTELLVSEGDFVKKNVIAARLDSEPYTIEKNTLLREIDLLEVKRKYQEINLERNRKLIKRSAVSQAEYDNAESLLGQIMQEIKMLESELRAVELEIQYATITAPFDGYIAKIITHQSEYLKVGDPIFKIIDSSRLNVVINFDESLVNELIKGQIVIFSLRNSKDIYKAVIIEVLPETDPETKTIRVIALIDNSSGLLKPGMIGTCLDVIDQVDTNRKK